MSGGRVLAALLAANGAGCWCCCSAAITDGQTMQCQAGERVSHESNVDGQRAYGQAAAARRRQSASICQVTSKAGVDESCQQGCQTTHDARQCSGANGSNAAGVGGAAQSQGAANQGQRCQVQLKADCCCCQQLRQRLSSSAAKAGCKSINA